jgi:Mrp family chromosome partitioning ATPase
LRVITSGPASMNPSELLGSDSMQKWVRYFQSTPDFDIVLIDTPPVLPVTGASALAASGALPILLVINARKTRSVEAIKAIEKLDMLGHKVLGIVLNAANPKEGSYYYHRYGK